MYKLLLALLIPFTNGFQGQINIEKKLLPLWFPILPINDVKDNRLYPITVADEKFTVYKNSENEHVCISDICPHQGASLSKGKLSKDKTVICPYHGFEFKDGVFAKMPQSNYFRSNSKICIPRLPTYCDSNFLYVLPRVNSMDQCFVPKPHEVIESKDNYFTKVVGQRLINTNCEVVTENVLDMLHISFVHSFGNRNLPLPYKISFEKVSNFTGITKFHYKSGANSISRQVGNQESVTVENEFHLPSTTVTRVIAGDIVKTVVTRALPISENKTLLFWELHRNFWHGKLGDWVMTYFMDKTLDEDINILKYVNPDYRIGRINTVYDVTITQYREMKNNLINEFLRI